MAQDGLFGWVDPLTARHWRVLAAAFLGWIFDGYETYALLLAIGPILQTLLPQSQYGQIPFYAGLSIGMTLLGWATGGLVGGILTDYIGRKRMMIYAVLGYALFTGLTALSTSVWMLIAFRFLTGIALGSEWETGTALLAESWPDEARAKGAGIMQSGFGFGSLIGAVAWFFLNPLGPQSWRYLFALGILPALVVLYLRTNVSESQMWLDAMEEIEEEGGERTFTLSELFSDPRDRTIIVYASIIGLATTAGWWGINFLVTRHVGAIAGGNAAHWESIAGIVYTVGGVCGYLSAGWIADWIGRKGYLYFVMIGSLVVTPFTFLWVHSLALLLLVVWVNGIVTLGQFAWFAIYLPELFTTEVRGSSLGFIFNAARFVAFAFPIVVGSIIATFGGPNTTAVAFGAIYVLGVVFTYFMPETVGQPLPE
ncbi:MAG: MFS transporter [Salinigranum sp.]